MEDIKNTQQDATQVEGQEVEVKTFTEEEVNKLLQAEADRRVSAALKKQEHKFLTQMQEAEKLRAMNEEQKVQYQLEQREKQIQEKEREFALLQNKYQAQSIMNEKNIPLAFVDFIVAEDAETMMSNITLFEREFRAAVRAEVDKRIASPAPKAGIGVAKGITKEEFSRMTLAQQSELYMQDPELFKQLSR